MAYIARPRLASNQPAQRFSRLAASMAPISACGMFGRRLSNAARYVLYYRAVAEAEHPGNLDVGAFFDAEFVVRHGNTVSGRLGVAQFCGRQTPRFAKPEACNQHGCWGAFSEG